MTSARKQLRSTVTRIYNDIPNFSSYDSTKKSTLKRRLEKLETELKSLDEKVCSQKFDISTESGELSLQIELASCEEYDEKICQCFSHLDVQPVVPEIRRTDVPASYLKSPVAPLPTFESNSGENLELFLQQFEQTTSKFNYTDYDRLLLLKQQIKGKALLLINSLESDKQTYTDAKTLLVTALASKSMLKFNVLKQLSEMKLTYDSEPFKYISDLRKVMQSFSQLQITTDDVLQYFFFAGMNDLFKNQMILVTNNPRPTLQEINDQFFFANERYEIELAKSKSKRESVSMPVTNAIPKFNDSNPFHKCSLCSEFHAINKCPKYSLPPDKIARLVQLKGCVKCGNIDHISDKCKFRFKKKCNMCSEWHFTFLCSKYKNFSNQPRNDHNAVAKNDKNSNERNNRQTQNSVVTNYCQASGSIDSILPTFTCFADGLKLRALRDSGSQSSFINASLLSRLNHEIIDSDIDLVLNGINESKSFKSKLVSLQVQLGNDTKRVEFLTIPDIRISLSLPGLPAIVSTFVSKGYQLADNDLVSGLQTIDKFDVIFGANSSFCFEDESIHFGRSSVYIKTQFGVMLYGHVGRMIDDLDSLRSADDRDKISVGALALDCRKIQTAATFDGVACGSGEQNYEIAARNVSVTDFEKYTDTDLEQHCAHVLNEDLKNYNDSVVDSHKEQINYLLKNVTLTDDGRIQMPLLWNFKVKHLLANNYKLSLNILNSNFKKLSKDEEKLNLADTNVKDLEMLKIIERIPNLEQFMKENPTCSFLPHMEIFRPHKDTTKCRMVFMSNLCDKSPPNNLSHNQVMFSGPCLNQKLSDALIMLRFDEKLMCFDLQKAFLQIKLPIEDQNKILFLWYKNVQKGDFTVQAFRNVRLSFGLRCSPTILMVALYYILVVRAEDDCPKVKALKKLMYALFYVDNGAITMENTEDLLWAYQQIHNIFNEFKFELQQCCTNDKQLKDMMDPFERIVSLFGLLWDTETDTLSTNKKDLNADANTKRKVLKTIAEYFDPYNYDGPLLNRAKLFLHQLQVQTDLDWDAELSIEQKREWRNICKQLNSAESVVIPRFVGNRADSYKLIAFTDSSKYIYGCVIYLLNIRTNKVSFLQAKSKIVGQNLKGKSIPALEFLGISLGVETLMELYNSLTGEFCMYPVDIKMIVLYSDSLVCLSWINSFVNRLDKMNKQSVFIRNRLEKLVESCDKFPITFTFVNGIQNPADLVTRTISFNLLSQSNYLTGPKFLVEPGDDMSAADTLSVTVPSGSSDNTRCEIAVKLVVANTKTVQHAVPVENYSNLDRWLSVYLLVLKAAQKFKGNIRSVNGNTGSTVATKEEVLVNAIKIEQMLQFPEIYEYFSMPSCPNNRMPNLVMQLNIFVDKKGLLRVGAKTPKNDKYGKNYFPLLLSKTGHFTKLIVLSAHSKLNHSGIYSVLSEVRRDFWIPNCFSVVKRILRECVHCKRYNGRTVKLNQNVYREERFSPINIAYAHIFIDYMGHYFVEENGITVKVWILVITCLWTRAVNLKVSKSLTTEEFLRSFQLHSYEYGVPQLVLSDLGSQLVAAGDIVTEFLRDPESIAYFEHNGAKVTTFEQYYKGCSSLGSLVESCVKLCKRLLSGSVKKNILPFRDFEFFVSQVVHIVNRRPIAFKEGLRDTSGDIVPDTITPELLIHGRKLLSINVVPSLQPVDDSCDSDFNVDPIDAVHKTHSKLCRVRANLTKIYNFELNAQLMKQATNDKSRYKPVTHNALEIGDIVLLKETNHKPTDYPMGVVVSLQTNSLGEVTGAEIKKGISGEIVKRHSSVIIPLLRAGVSEPDAATDDCSGDGTEGAVACDRERPPRRAAALRSEQRSRDLLRD